MATSASSAIRPGSTDLTAQLPADVTKAELTRFVEGLPQRYLQLFPPDAIYQHVRLARDIRPDEVHLSLDRVDGAVWSLAVVTLDKPTLFSNICGVLSSFGMNILRGNALTNPERPGARRVPVHRRRAFPGDERRRAGADHRGARRRRRRPRGRGGAAARARARRAAPEVVDPLSAGRPGRQRDARAATRFSTSSRRMRWACCTGSAASSPNTAVTSTSC